MLKSVSKEALNIDFFNFLRLKNKTKTKMVKNKKYQIFRLNTNNNPPVLYTNKKLIRLSKIFCIIKFEITDYI